MGANGPAETAMHDTLKLTFWRQDAVTQALLREAAEALASTGRGTLQPSYLESATRQGADPEMAYRIGHDAEAHGLGDDEARTWLWFAAANGHPAAARQLALILKAESIAAPSRERAALRRLSDAWFASASQDEDGQEGPEGDGYEAGFIGGVSDPTGLVEAAAPPVAGRVVVGAIGDAGSKEGVDLGKRFGAFVGTVLPYRGRVPEPGVVRAGILARWPWAGRAADVIENHFAVQRRSRADGVRVPNLLLVGPKGCGKSSMARWIYEAAGLAHTLIPCGGVNDAAGLTPVTRAWATTRPGAVFQAMATHGVCNPGLVLDEIDKTTAAGSQNGSVSAALLSMVGEERFHDACLMADVDVSRVSYIATANSVEAVDEFLRDRFEVVMVPAPRVEDLPTLHANAVADFMRRNDLDAASVPALGTAERRALAGLFEKRGRSARAYYQMLESRIAKAMAERERMEMEALATLEKPSATMH